MSFKESNSLPSISCICPKNYEGCPHFLQLQTTDADETAKHYQVKSSSDMSFLRESIASILPSLTEAALEAVITRLVDDIGVETREDLIHVRENDFSGILKPIPARKLIHSWKENSYTCVTQCSSLDPLNSSVESYRLVPVTEGTDLTQLTVSPTNAATFNTIPQRRHPENSISVPYIVTVGSSEVNLLDTTTAPPPQPPPQLPPQTPPTTSSNALLREKYVPHDKNWIKSYSIPWNKVRPKIKETLSKNGHISLKLKRELIRVIGEDIFAITKRPTPHDLQVVAKLMTDAYPALVDGKDEADGNGSESLFVRLRNRLNFKRKKEAYVAKSMGLTMDWLENFNVPWHKMSPKIRNSLNIGAQLEPHMKREMIRVVADEIIQLTFEPRARHIRSLSQQMVDTYFESLSDREDGVPNGKCENVYKTLEFRLHYLIKKWRKSQSEGSEMIDVKPEHPDINL